MGSKRRSILIGVIILMVAVAVLASAGFLLRDRSAQLARSIEVVLVERLDLSGAHITQAALSDPLETDSHGYWSVDIGSSSEQLVRVLRNVGFGESDQVDTEYFKSAMQRELSSGDLAPYRSFEASVALGGGTICDKSACSVVVLLAEGQQTVFVAIWRI